MRDLVHGLRMLRRSPGLAAAAILSIGLGIGATTAIFGVVRHVLLRPLPFADPDRLVVLWETSADDPDRWVAPANFLDWQRDTAASSTAWRPTTASPPPSPGMANPSGCGPSRRRARSSPCSASRRRKAARSMPPTTGPVRRAWPC